MRQVGLAKVLILRHLPNVAGIQYRQQIVAGPWNPSTIVIDLRGFVILVSLGPVR
jgi:hypothetical protein